MLWARKPGELLLSGCGKSLFECFEDDSTEVEFVFVEICPIERPRRWSRG
jgi:hypothetical protein